MSIIFFFSTSELLVTLKKGEKPSCVACKLYECSKQNCNPSLCDDRYFTDSCRRNRSPYKTHSLITKKEERGVMGTSRGGECLKSHSSTKPVRTSKKPSTSVHPLPRAIPSLFRLHDCMAQSMLDEPCW